MKNPLHKRLPRQLKSEFGKYVVIFLLLIGSIGFISGFLVAAKSISKTYDESFKVYNIENGNFEMLSPLSDEAINEIENQEKISIYNNYYIEEDTDTNLNDKYDSTLKIFKDRKKVNKVCLMEGKKPDNKDEIAIDRMYANNNDVEVGDYIKVSGKKLKVTGFVALSDGGFVSGMSTGYVIAASSSGLTIELGFQVGYVCGISKGKLLGTVAPCCFDTPSIPDIVPKG